MPLHTNGSERDIREYVKRRKVRGGTRSEEGRRCRDAFASLKKTWRKLGVSFWDYLLDRVRGRSQDSTITGYHAAAGACPGVFEKLRDIRVSY